MRSYFLKEFFLVPRCLNNFSGRCDCLNQTSRVRKFSCINHVYQQRSILHFDKIFLKELIGNFHFRLLSSDIINKDVQFREFDSLNPYDKRSITKRFAGIKASFLQDKNFLVSNDLKTLLFAYNRFCPENSTEVKTDRVLYSQFEKIDGVPDENGVEKKIQPQKFGYFKETWPCCQHEISLSTFSFTIFNSRKSKKNSSIEKSESETGFWLNMVQNDESVVIFDELFDALAFHHQTDTPTIVLKSGYLDETDSTQQKFFTDLNGHFEKIIFWCHNKKFDQSFAEILTLNKVFLVDPTYLKAFRMFQKNKKEKYQSVLNNLIPFCDPSIVKVEDFKDDIFKELTDDAVNGVQWSRFPKLNEHLKGHRPGELTVVTGPTGCGKTTFVSEYSLDLLMQGVPTLWGSFEIKNVRLAKMMLTQFAKMNLDSQEEFSAYFQEFQMLPLYFMDFHGQTDMELVMRAMKNSVLTRNVKHVIIDNLQFMLGLNVESTADRFLKQDHLIDLVRNFCTEYDCHVTLVAHPRKERDDIAMSNNSLYGGVKVSQEADNVLIIMNKFNSRFRCNKYIQITKNRYNGSLGIVPLFYDKNSSCFSSSLKDQLSHSSTDLFTRKKLEKNFTSNWRVVDNQDLPDEITEIKEISIQEN